MRGDDQSSNDAERGDDALEPLLTMEDMERLFKQSAWTITRKVKAGLLPPPIKLSDSTVRWSPAAIRRKLRELQEAADAEYARRAQKRKRSKAA